MTSTQCTLHSLRPQTRRASTPRRHMDFLGILVKYFVRSRSVFTPTSSLRPRSFKTLPFLTQLFAFSASTSLARLHHKKNKKTWSVRAQKKEARAASLTSIHSLALPHKHLRGSGNSCTWLASKSPERTTESGRHPPTTTQSP